MSLENEMAQYVEITQAIKHTNERKKLHDVIDRDCHLNKYQQNQCIEVGISVENGIP